MLTQSFTHKSHKITTLTTDSYKQLFVLITMLLTVLSAQPSTFTMAAPLEQPQQYQLRQTQQRQQQQYNLPYDTLQHSQLQEILLTEKLQYKHDYHYNYLNHNHHLRQHLRQHQLETDFVVNENNGEDNDEEERLHKREISWHDYYNSIMQSQAINWYNPCGGISKMEGKPVKRKRPPPIKKVSFKSYAQDYYKELFFIK